VTQKIEEIILDAPLTPGEIVAIAKGAQLVLSPAALDRLAHARQIVEGLVEQNIRGYGINTGVGGLCDVIVSSEQQSHLSHNILLSHACGVGDPLPKIQARAIMAVQINNFALGFSGVRLETVTTLLALLNADIVPLIPSRGSLGYLTHAASIGLVLIGQGEALFQENHISGAQALERAGCKTLTLAAKEGLSLVNGSPCASGLATIALEQMKQLVEWADCAAALTYAVLGNQNHIFDDAPMRLRQSPGLMLTAQNLRHYLAGCDQAGRERRTQDPMSLRAVPQVHGAVRDSLVFIEQTLERELASVTDNPLVTGTPQSPQVYSQAHAVSTALAFAMDHLGVVATQLGMISERRTDRLLNPLVSGLPAFLSGQSGVQSGLMIAQYTACALCGENRRLAAPASLDGGITSAIQEDVLPHSTPASEKALAIIDNLALILAIELLCAAQAHDLAPHVRRGPYLENLHQRIRAKIEPYADQRPLNADFAYLAHFLREEAP